jgi:LSM domain
MPTTVHGEASLRPVEWQSQGLGDTEGLRCTRPRPFPLFPCLYLKATSQLTQTQQVFLNIVLDEAVEEKAGGEKVRLGMVVIRGNSVVMLEVSCSITHIERVLTNNVLQLRRHWRESEATGIEGRLKQPRIFPAAASEYGRALQEPSNWRDSESGLWGYHPLTFEMLPAIHLEMGC